MRQPVADRAAMAAVKGLLRLRGLPMP